MQFVAKINKSSNPTVILDETMNIVNGVNEGYLKHDNVKHSTAEVWTEPNKSGVRIYNYILENPADASWKSKIRIYADAPLVYITYESYGDQVEAEDINHLQQAVMEVFAQVNTFSYTQIAPLDTWVISHMLGKRPAVTIVDSGGTVVQGEVSYVSDDVVTVGFQAPFAGTAYLN